MNSKKFALGMFAMCCATYATAEGDLKSIFDEGTVSGNIRAYYNTREYPSKTDISAFALGGALRAETGALGMFKFGVGYYAAQDLGMNDSDPAKVNKSLGSDIEVLGEAYVKLASGKSALTVGRQLINTPFANNGDAFIVPFAFSGASFKNTSVAGFTFEVDYLNDIKNRNSGDFVNVGKWTGGRYGVGGEETEGTLILGATYSAVKDLKVQGWYYNFSDFFTTLYAQADYKLPGNFFVAGQMASQKETGDELLGAVDSSLIGVQGGFSVGSAKFTLGYDSVAEEADAFKNGAFLAPYSFSTSPLFTNNMLATLENVDAGSAIKFTFNYSFQAPLDLKISYATLDYDTAVDVDAVDVDLTYKFSDYWKGLSLRWRVEVMSADLESAEQTNNRFQLQYVF